MDKSGSLPPAQTRTFTATLTTGCGQIKNPFVMIVTAGGTDLQPVTATVEAKPKTPDWDALQKWFFLSTLVALALMVIVLIVASIKGTPPSASLPSLDDSWSFKDSWVSNVTVVGGLLAGIFGSSDVLTGVLGDDADEALALATIGGAVAVALIGAAGVVVIALKTISSGKFTAFGVLAGSTIALGAAGGQLGAVYECARKLELGGEEDHLSKYLIAGLVLLGVYGFLSVLGVLIQGHTEKPDEDPAAEPVSESLFAAAVIAASVNEPDTAVTREKVNGILTALKPDVATRDMAAPVRARKATGVPSMVVGTMAVRGSGRAALP